MRPDPEFQSRRLDSALNILLLEDDAAFAQLVREHLDQVPWAQLRLEWVDTLAGALACLEKRAFDLVITDLDTPHSRGLDTVETLAHASDRLVIVMTGDPKEGLREAAVARGACDLVSKGGLDRVGLERLVRLASMQAKTFRSLRESEERFRSLTQMSSDWYWEQDEELRYLPRAAGKGGLDGRCLPADIGKRRWELDGIYGVTEAQWQEHRQLLAQGKPFRDFEYRRDYEGAQRWLSISGEPVFDGQGRFKGYRGIGRDITERKRSESEKQRLDRMYAALSAANEVILRARSRDVLLGQVCQIAVDIGRVLLAVVYLRDEGTLELRRVAASGAAAKLSAHRRPSMDPANPRGQGLTGLACRTGQPVISNDYEADPRKQKRPEWHTYPVGSVALFPLKVEGEIAGVFGLQHAERNAFSEELTQLLQRLADNISFALGNFGRDAQRKRGEEALRESEGRFRSLTELSSDFYWRTDGEHRMLEVTHGSGHRPIMDHAIGKARWELPSTYPDAAGWTRFKAIMDWHKPFRDFEFARINAAGEERHAAVTGEPVFGTDGSFLGYRGIGRDITARKREERMVGLEHAVTRVLAEAQDPAEAVRKVIRAICEAANWEGGRFFSLDEAAGLLRFRGFWSSRKGAMERFMADSGKLGYARGEGLVGKAWETGDIEWTSEPGSDPRVKHPELARQAGLKSSFSLPVHFEGRVCGVLSISSTSAHSPDGRFLKALGVIGSQLGQFFQRLRAEEDQRRFRAAIDASADMVLLVDPAATRYVDANESACRTLGYERVELLAAGPAQVVSSSVEDLRALYTRLVDGDERSREMVEGVYRRKDGSLLLVELNRQAVPSAGGHLIVIVAREITARKRAEQLLKLEHTVTRVLAEADSVSSGLRAVLREVCETEGWDYGRYFARDEKDMFRFAESWHVPSPDLERYIEYSAGKAFPIRVGIVGLAGAGEPQWVEDVSLDRRVVSKPMATVHGVRGAFMFPVASNGQSIGVLSFTSREVRRPDERLLQAVGVIGSQVAQFLTRKQAELALSLEEARFRQTFELAASGMAHVALDGRYLRVNRRLCEILGYSEQELVGRTVKDVSHPDDRGVMDAALARLRRGELPSIRNEKRYIGKDGSVVWVALSVAVARDAGGAPQYDISVYEDITARKKAEDALRRFRAALDGSADMVFLVDLNDLSLLDCNDTACSYLGYARAELLGIKSGVVIVDAPETDINASFARLLAEPGRADSVIRTYKRKDGRTFEAEVLRRVIESPNGPILVLNARDLTDRNLAQQRQALHVRYQEKIARFGESALGKRESSELVEDAVRTVHEALRVEAVLYVEPGQAPLEVVARGMAGNAGPSSGAAAYASTHPLALALEHGELAIIGEGIAPLPYEWAKGFPSAALVPVHGDHRVQGALCALSSKEHAFGAEESKFLVTAASVLSAGLRRIDSEGRLAFLAQFDALTGLPNRSLLRDRFSQMIVHARRHAMPLGVLFIDLDDFKLVNDTLGHAGGDELLKEMGRRLQSAVRPGDTVARISGDEFAVILADLAKPDDAALVAQKVIDRLAAPMQIGDQEVFVTASIGIAAFPADGDDAEALLGAADAAMYRAKQSGRNSFEFFTADINQRSRARAQLGVELRRALERDEFVVVYQPKFDLRSGQPCAAEALLRWRHPERGLVAPAEFIPVLEETGLIVPVGEWVLRRACEDLVSWKAAGVRQIPVAVNLSARQFRLQDLDARIRAIVSAAGIEPHLVELEITESQLMLDPEHAKRMMRSLSETGIRVAIDDFGTGYSSLSYLTRFPVSALKIDRSFVADVLKDQADAAIVRTIIDMAHTLGFIVIAEGVETDAQAALLRSLGCEQAQGYFFARPMPEADLRALISASIEPRPGNSRFASRYQ